MTCEGEMTVHKCMCKHSCVFTHPACPSLHACQPQNTLQDKMLVQLVGRRSNQCFMCKGSGVFQGSNIVTDKSSMLPSLPPHCKGNTCTAYCMGQSFLIYSSFSRRSFQLYPCIETVLLQLLLHNWPCVGTTVQHRCWNP